MLDHLEIKNFKSVEHLNMDCRRINVLIGEPNTGKSNILEALGLISYVGHFNTARNDLRPFVRYDDLSNLFHDYNLSQGLHILFGGEDITDVPVPVERRYHLQLHYSDGEFKGGVQELASSRGECLLFGDHDSLTVTGASGDLGSLGLCKFYRFAPMSTFRKREGDSLLPPSGDNLFSLLYRDRDLRAEANALFLSRGLRLGLRPQENKIEVIKALEDVIISQPYHLASDTFQRLVFYMAALRTNSDSVLVFEEPEAHAFPYYTKYLAERIALDEKGNQFFVSTHNPYFLLPIIEKTLSDDLAVFITYYDNHRTQVRQLAQDEIETIFDDVDVFSNIDMFLED